VKLKAMNPLRIFKKQQDKNGRHSDDCAPAGERDKDADDLQRVKDELRRFEYDLRELAKL
jgi:hypothetical protein